MEKQSIYKKINENCGVDDNSLFLGIIKKKYIKTFHGALHGITALLALVLGIWLCTRRFLFGDRNISSNTKLTFFVSNTISSLIILIFFWNKVQAWALSTTSLKDKGLTSQQMQNCNRARGVIVLIQASLYPVIVAIFPNALLESTIFSNAIALALLSLVAYTCKLLGDYGKKLILAYGLINVGLALSIISSGSISSLSRNYPKVLDIVEKDSYFVITSVQFGFMLYYLYSRNVVSKSLVQAMCRNFHVTLTCLYFARLSYDGYIKAVPICMLLHPILISLFALIKVCPLLLTTILQGTYYHHRQQQRQSDKENKKESHHPHRNSLHGMDDSKTSSSDDDTAINSYRRASSSSKLVLKRVSDVCPSRRLFELK